MSWQEVHGVQSRKWERRYLLVLLSILWLFYFEGQTSVVSFFSFTFFLSWVISPLCIYSPVFHFGIFLFLFFCGFLFLLFWIAVFGFDYQILNCIVPRNILFQASDIWIGTHRMVTRVDGYLSVTQHYYLNTDVSCSVSLTMELISFSDL